MFFFYKYSYPSRNFGIWLPINPNKNLVANAATVLVPRAPKLWSDHEAQIFSVTKGEGGSCQSSVTAAS